MFLKYHFYNVLLFLTVFCQGAISYGQNPNYFVLGKAKLENTEIYSILHTPDKKLYVATNEGLYQYKHGKMNVIPNATGQNGFDVFDLTVNSKNEVFCYNLSGQILTISNNKLEVYKQIPSKYLNANMSIAFDEKNRLLFASNGALLISKNIDELYFNESQQILAVDKLIDGQIVFTQNESDKVMLWKNDSLVPYEMDSYLNTLSFTGDNILIGDKVRRSKSITKLLNPEDGANLYRYKQIKSDEIWRRSSLTGIDVITSFNDEIDSKKSYFKETFISEIAQGVDGTIYLGTFGQGVLVIPNRETIIHNLEKLGTNIRGITTSPTDDVFLTDAAKGIIHYKEKATLLDSNFKRVPEHIYYLKSNEHRLIDRFPRLYYDNYIYYGAGKDVFEVDDNTLLIASSKGILKTGDNYIFDSLHWRKREGVYNKFFHTLEDIDERCQSVAYDSISKKMYVAQLSKVLVFENENTPSELKYKNKSIAVNKLLMIDHQLWCATQDYGILVFEDTIFKKRIALEEGIESNYIHKILNDENSLYVLHKEGFQVINLKTNKIETFGPPEGITDGSMRDFSITNDKIWYVSNNELFSTPIKLKDIKPDYTLIIDSVAVNGKSINHKEQINFKHHENELEVFIDFRGISYEKEAQINYKLTGFDKQWQSVTTQDKSISYKYLPPGTYNLEVKTLFRCITDTTFSYAFKVQKPYWQTWWFILFTLLILILFIVLYVNNRTKTINKKTREKLERQQLKSNLIETELKAMRSQMNPHFIFNSLNSIQDLILQEDTDASYDYIVLFSNLVRNTLHYSNENFISLEKEIAFLETYLKLEELRFDDSFTYKIERNDLKDISVPSLILQPFVENAIIHGLFHKEGRKLLEIGFGKSGAFIHCTIKDNGIGRENAKSIKIRQGSKHKSFALTSIEKRLEILKNKYGNEVGYSINDLQSKNESIGTEVTIVLPFLD